MKLFIVAAALVAAVSAIPFHWNVIHQCCPDEVLQWNACRAFDNNPNDCASTPGCMWCPYNALQISVLRDLEVCTAAHDKCDCHHPSIPPIPTGITLGICYSANAPTCVLDIEPVPNPPCDGKACNPGMYVDLHKGKCPVPYQWPYHPKHQPY